jgi:DNA polymerase-4
MIIFLQVPGFYAAVEQADHPDLRGRPVIVGGDPRKRGTVTGVSAEARQFGVNEGSEVRASLERCPNAVYRATRLRRYREVSAELSAILRQTTDRVEPEGLASFYLECPERAEPLSLAAELCVRLQAELMMQAAAGIGPTRFVAHLAARHHAPRKIRQVLPGNVREFLAEFPVTEIWGLGPATAKRLTEHSVTRIADLQKLELSELEAMVGRNASAFLSLATGTDHEPLRPMRRPKSLSQEKTLPEPCRDLSTLGEVLAALAGQLETMLTREHRAARTVSLGIDYMDGDQSTRTQTVSEPLTRRVEIGEVAVQLLARTQAGVRHCRRLRLQVTNLCRADSEGAGRQLRLF